MQGESVSVQYVSLLDGSSSGPTALDLRDALPLESLLAPLCTCKERLAQAIDLLRPDVTPELEASLDASSATPPELRRGFGGALQVQTSATFFTMLRVKFEDAAFETVRKGFLCFE